MKSTIGPLIGREWYRIAIAICTMLLASCSSTQPAVPIEAADASLSSLAGNWVGEYSSSATGRRGSIVGRGSRLADRGPRTTKEISGRLDSYRDPMTGAMLTTTFTGRKHGNTIEGTFESMSADAVTPQPGRWRVTRQ